MTNNNDSTSALAENKVLILYILDKVKDLNESGLFKIISSVNNINYFYFKQFLTDLKDSKLVTEYTKDEKHFIELSSEGKKYLTLIQDDVLPGIVKLKVDNSLKEELSSIVDESSVVAEFMPKDKNGYMVKCKIVENTETIFEVKTFAGSQERANQIVDNWNSNASTIYPKILNTLLNK